MSSIEETAVNAAKAGAEASGKENRVDFYDENGNYTIVIAQPTGSYEIDREHNAPK